MKSMFFAAAALLALAVTTSTANAAQPAKSTKAAAKPVAQDWLKVSNRTAEGAIVIGNPAAKVKLVEYLSLTCPHCADLSKEALPPLQRDYIAKGQVSLEVRHAVRDGYDFVASLLLRCESPAAYLGSLEALFATQEEWMTKGANAKNVPGFESMSEDDKLMAVAKLAGFDAFFAKRGMTPKVFAACMADEKAKTQLAQMAGNAWQRDSIPGTPLMLVNGERKEEAHSWAALEPLIKAALK